MRKPSIEGNDKYDTPQIMRNIGLEVMELTNITRCISASLSCSSVVMYRFFHQVDLPTKSRCKIITQSPLINHWIGDVVKLIDEIDIRIRMSLPSSHGTEQVQFIDMMPQRDRTSNLRYLLRRGVPRNRVKRILITPGKSLCRIPPHRARDSTGAVTPMDSATLFCEKPNRLRFSLSSCIVPIPIY